MAAQEIFFPALIALVGTVKILPSKHTISNHFFTVSTSSQLGVSLAQIDRLETVNIEYQNNYMNDIFRPPEGSLAQNFRVWLFFMNQFPPGP